MTEINDKKFSARLTDLTAGATYAGEEADIPLDEISEADAAKMKVGSIFRWVIGYERTAGSVPGDGGWSSRSDLHAISRTSPGRRPAATCEYGFEPMREFLPIERWLPIAELGIDSARGRPVGERILETPALGRKSQSLEAGFRLTLREGLSMQAGAAVPDD